MSIKLALEPLQLQKGCMRKEAVQLPLQGEGLASFLQEQGIAQATVIIWQINKIFWGRWENGRFLLPEGQTLRPELWLEIRIFNEAMELKLVSEDGSLKGRFLEEGSAEGEPCEYVDSLSRLWGEAKEQQGSWMVMEDRERKLRQLIPAPSEQSRFYGLVTRNYVGVSGSAAQAGYEDYRYVKICAADIER